MTEEERKEAYEFIAQDNTHVCPGLTARDVQAIHQGLINGAVRGRFAQDPCYSHIRSGLEAQGLVGQNRTDEKVIFDMTHGT